MVKNIVEKGPQDKPIIIFNRTTARAEKLASSLPDGKTKVAKTIEEAIEPSDIIFTCVGDDKAIEETVDTCLKSGLKGKLFVDCSTIHPDTTMKISKKITDAGNEFVACPGEMPKKRSRNMANTQQSSAPQQWPTRASWWPSSPDQKTACRRCCHTPKVSCRVRTLTTPVSPTVTP